MAANQNYAKWDTLAYPRFASSALVLNCPPSSLGFLHSAWNPLLPWGSGSGAPGGFYLMLTSRALCQGCGPR